jgi:hypothetical protein
MKLTLLLLVGVLLLLVGMPVYANSFGITPSKVSTQLGVGQSADLKFTITGYNGLVEVYPENMPVTIFPTTFNVIDSSLVTVSVKCNNDAVSRNYDGRIVFLAKSGDSVQSGIKTICNLTVTGDTITEEQTTNPTMLIIWVGFLVSLLIGIVYLTYRFRNK